MCVGGWRGGKGGGWEGWRVGRVEGGGGHHCEGGRGRPPRGAGRHRHLQAARQLVARRQQPQRRVAPAALGQLPRVRARPACADGEHGRHHPVRRGGRGRGGEQPVWVDGAARRGGRRRGARRGAPPRRSKRQVDDGLASGVVVVVVVVVVGVGGGGGGGGGLLGGGSRQLRRKHLLESLRLRGPSHLRQPAAVLEHVGEARLLPLPPREDAAQPAWYGYGGGRQDAARPVGSLAGKTQRDRWGVSRRGGAGLQSRWSLAGALLQEQVSWPDPWRRPPRRPLPTTCAAAPRELVLVVEADVVWRVRVAQAIEEGA